MTCKNPKYSRPNKYSLNKVCQEEWSMNKGKRYVLLRILCAFSESKMMMSCSLIILNLGIINMN
jgi:hypothetical protein